MISVTDIMNRAVAEPITQEQIVETIYQGLLSVKAAHDDDYADLLMIDKLDEKRQQKLKNFGSATRARISELFAEDKYAPLARKAMQMDKTSLDICCRIAVEHFMEDQILSEIYLSQLLDDMTAETNFAQHSEVVAHIKENLRCIFPSYQKLSYRIEAGPLFGFPVGDVDRAEFKKQKQAMFDEAVFCGLNRQSIHPQKPISEIQDRENKK